MTLAHKPTTVDILGRIYQIKCSESEVDSLKAAAKAVDKRMRDIRTKTQVLCAEKLAILTALQLAHELVSAQEIQDGEARVDASQLQNLIGHLDRALKSGE